MHFAFVYFLSNVFFIICFCLFRLNRFPYTRQYTDLSKTASQPANAKIVFDEVCHYFFHSLRSIQAHEPDSEGALPESLSAHERGRIRYVTTLLYVFCITLTWYAIGLPKRWWLLRMLLCSTLDQPLLKTSALPWIFSASIACFTNIGEMLIHWCMV